MAMRLADSVKVVIPIFKKICSISREFSKVKQRVMQKIRKGNIWNPKLKSIFKSYATSTKY